MKTHKLVPVEALEWLFGESGTFECPKDRYFLGAPAPFWWRSVFREKIAAAPPCPTGDDPKGGEAWYPSYADTVRRAGWWPLGLSDENGDKIIRASIDLYRERIAADRDGARLDTDRLMFLWGSVRSMDLYASGFDDCFHSDIARVRAAIDTATQAQEQGNG